MVIKGYIFTTHSRFPIALQKPNDMEKEEFFLATEEILQKRVKDKIYCGYLITLENENETEEKK